MSPRGELMHNVPNDPRYGMLNHEEQFDVRLVSVQKMVHSHWSVEKLCSNWWIVDTSIKTLFIIFVNQSGHSISPDLNQ